MKLLFTLLLLISMTAFAGRNNRLKERNTNKFSQRQPLEVEVKDEPGFAARAYNGLISVFSSKNIAEQTVAQMEYQETQVANIEEPVPSYLMDDSACYAPGSYTCLEISNEKSDYKNYTSDLQVCRCLESRFDLPIKQYSEMTDKEKAERDQKVEEGKLFAALLDFKKKFISHRDALLLEAHFVEPHHADSMLKASQTKELTKALTDAIDSFKGKVSDKAYKDALLMVKNYSDHPVSVIENLNKNMKRAESCYPFSRYLPVSMIPKENEFWASLLRTDNPTTEDWNYQSLIFEYRKPGSNKEEIKAKLDFLHKNPTLKGIFASGNQELITKTYKRLKSVLKPSASCIKAGNCRSLMFKNKVNLQKELSDIYQDEEVKKLAAGVSFVNSIVDVSEIHTAGLEIATVPALRMAFAHDDVRYDNCDTNTSPAVAPHCASIFQNYCSELYAKKDQALTKLLTLEDEPMYPNDWIDDLAAEPSENKGYLEHERDMCTKLARKIKGTNRVVNFQGFKESYCKENASLCENVEDVDLFDIFISQTQKTDKVFNDFNQLVNDETGMHMLAESQISVGEASDALLGRVQGFADKSNNVSITEVINEVGSTKSEKFDLANLSYEINDSADKILDDKNYLTEDGLPEDLFNYTKGNQGLIGNHSYANEALSDARNELLELKKEEESIKDEISQVKGEITSAPSSETNKALEARLENLEKLLAEKEKTSQNYQDLISKLMDANQAPPKDNSLKAAEKASTITQMTEGMEATRRTQPVVVASAKPSFSDEQHTTSGSRGPASVENFSSSAGIGGGASVVSTSFGSQAARSGGNRINGALLSKYGIMVHESPGSTVNVAPEAESVRFQALAPFREATNIPLEVSQKAFEKFKVNDLSALQELYQDSLEKIDDEVIKILVSSEESEETLEFYAIKEDGKVVFQPLRKNKLSDLKNTFSQY